MSPPTEEQREITPSLAATAVEGLTMPRPLERSDTHRTANELGTFSVDWALVPDGTPPP